MYILKMKVFWLNGKYVIAFVFLFRHFNVLESIERRMSRIIPELRHLDYPGRLRILKITTLEKRRVRADLWFLLF